MAGRQEPPDDSWTEQEEEGVPVSRELEYPVSGMSGYDAEGFCQWLTQKEAAEGKLPRGAKYRLPTNKEWSCPSTARPPRTFGAIPKRRRRYARPPHPKKNPAASLLASAALLATFPAMTDEECAPG